MIERNTKLPRVHSKKLSLETQFGIIKIFTKYGVQEFPLTGQILQKMRFLYLVQKHSRNKSFCNRFANTPGNIRISHIQYIDTAEKQEFLYSAQTLPKTLHPTKNIKTEIFMPHEANPLDACLPACRTYIPTKLLAFCVDSKN
jgi:hypothetical protein